MSEHHIDVIFCDDIRHESSGKITLVGTYTSGILTSGFPITLPKLGVAIRIRSSSENLIKTLAVKILFEDEVLKDWAPPEDDPPLTDPEGDVVRTQCYFVLSPIQIEEAGRLKVQVTINGEEIDFPDFPVELNDSQ